MKTELNTYKNRKNPLFTEVDLYRNTRKRCWSLRVRETGVIHAHAEQAVLKDVRWIIREERQRRARETDRRIPHAFARGVLIPSIGSVEGSEWSFRTHRVAYNPNEHDQFVTAWNEEPISFSPYATFGVLQETKAYMPNDVAAELERAQKRIRDDQRMHIR